VNAGADFIITQAVFDIQRFREWVAALEDRELPDKVCLIAGIMWFKSAEQARQYSETYQGMTVPDDIINRLDQAADGEQEGLRIALEMIEQVKELSSIRGVHLWAREREGSLPELLDAAKLSVESP
jgi:methylenetetrahydrofolate reductase (NADPH)